MAYPTGNMSRDVREVDGWYKYQIRIHDFGKVGALTLVGRNLLNSKFRNSKHSGVLD